MSLALKKTLEDWSFSEFTPSQTSKLSHGYHRYPAKFIPQLVEKLFDRYLTSDTAHINDPFMGSGTTIVSGITRGYKTSGTDVNKISHLITKVKSTPINPTLLYEKNKDFLSKIRIITDNQYDIVPTIPQNHLERIDYWFLEKDKIHLGKILTFINNEKNEIIRDFWLVCFSNTLKNISIWLQSSTKPTRDKNKKIADIYAVFKRQLAKMERGNLAFYNIVPNHIKENIEKYLNIKAENAENQPVKNESVDLIVSSSPYVTSYEYADLHQLSTIWLDLADNLQEYRKEFIGTAYKKNNNYNFNSEIGHNIINQLADVSQKLSNEVACFFYDMEKVFNESYRILKKGARCCYVIGDTALKGVKIENSKVFIELLESVGFSIDDVIIREIPLKILPQTRDAKTGKFAKKKDATAMAYPVEYIIVGKK